ncbi:hypothetical protein [Prauserella sp. PE36]|nr:hypothetical protein [Prauserella sp. PE36]
MPVTSASTRSVPRPVPLNLALNSGDFGEIDMFTTAWDSLATA